MKYTKTLMTSLLVAVFLSLPASPSTAAVNLAITQLGENYLRLTFSGTWGYDADETSAGPNPVVSLVNYGCSIQAHPTPGYAFLTVDSYDIPWSISAPINFIPASMTNPAGGFIIQGEDGCVIYGPGNFTGTTPITGSIELNNSLDDLGLTLNTSGVILVKDSQPLVTYTVANVPEPNTWGCIGGLGLLGWLVCRKRCRTAT